MSKELRAGVATTAVTAQPWYENVLAPGLANPSATPNNTGWSPITPSRNGIPWRLADNHLLLAAFGILPPTWAWNSQFDETPM